MSFAHVENKISDKKLEKSSGSNALIRKKGKTQTENSPFENIIHLQRNIGNQGVQTLMNCYSVQTKLRLGNPEDKFEQEAELVANAIMSGSKKEKQQIDNRSIQSKQSDVNTSIVNRNLESHIKSLKNGGQPIPSLEHALLKPYFNEILNQVRIHTDAEAAETAKVLNAKAFTIDKNIFFGQGEYVPNNQSSRHLLVHELTHVLQQSNMQSNILQKKETESGLSEFDKILPVPGFKIVFPLPENIIATPYFIAYFSGEGSFTVRPKNDKNNKFTMSWKEGELKPIIEGKLVDRIKYKVGPEGIGVSSDYGVSSFILQKLSFEAMLQWKIHKPFSFGISGKNEDLEIDIGPENKIKGELGLKLKVELCPTPLGALWASYWAPYITVGFAATAALLWGAAEITELAQEKGKARAIEAAMYSGYAWRVAFEATNEYGYETAFSEVEKIKDKEIFLAIKEGWEIADKALENLSEEKRDILKKTVASLYGKEAVKLHKRLLNSIWNKKEFPKNPLELIRENR